MTRCRAENLFHLPTNFFSMVLSQKEKTTYDMCERLSTNRQKRCWCWLNAGDWCHSNTCILASIIRVYYVHYDCMHVCTLYMYVCVYVSMRMCVYMYVLVCMNVRISVYVCMHVCVCLCVSICTVVRTCMRVCRYECIGLYAYMCVTVYWCLHVYM